MSAPLSNTVSLIRELRERLKALYDLRDGDEVLETTLEGSSNLDEQIAAIAREAVVLEAEVEGLKVLQKRLQQRRERKEHGAEKRRALVAWALSESGGKSVRAPDLSVTLSNGEKELLIDENAFLPVWATRPQKQAADRRAIREALESGRDLSFAKFGNQKPVLTIRT